MDVRELAPGLWRWTGLHPAWSADDPVCADWEPEVACVYYEAPDAIVLVDPLLPPEDSDRFLRALDRDVDRAQRPVHVLLTTPWHGRSAETLAERYRAEVWVHAESASLQPPAPTRTFALGQPLPGEVEPRPAAPHEVVLWIGAHRALVFPDVVVGNGRGGVELCPEIWLTRDGRGTHAELRETLRPLLALPAERLLVSHGEPVLDGGGTALARALAA